MKVSVSFAEKTCTKCKVKKPLSEFSPHRQARGGFNTWCKACTTANNRRRYQQDPEFRARARDWQLKNPELYARSKRRSWLKQKFGISLEEYDAMLEAQGGVCAICGKSPNGKHLDVDHDHETGRVRGLLHGRCNAALGLFNDDPKLLRRASEYLEATV